MALVDEALAVQLGLSLIFPKQDQFWESLERLIRVKVKQAINDSKVEALDISKIVTLLDAKVEEALKQETNPESETVAEPEPVAETEGLPEPIEEPKRDWVPIKKSKRRNNWTKENMQTFLDDFDKYTTDLMLEKYGMTLKTLYVTRSKFKRLVQER